ncbi:hypothetical protein ACFWA9_04955 [Kitasatospora sp. NPDC059973]|uniref:hypothetical protein n=1 Tax=Kitasatospora sp. NPDC059973 TaxID=3347020 RepID=UPI003696C49E
MTTPASEASLSIDVIDHSRAELAGVLEKLLDLLPTEFRRRGPGATVLHLDDAEDRAGPTVVIQADQLDPLVAMLAELLPDR